MKRTTIYQATGIILTGITGFVFFRFFYPYHLMHREQMLLFTYTTQHLGSYFDRPAPLACLMGDFLTQFFYHAATGALLVSAVWMSLYALLFRTARKWVNAGLAFAIAFCITAWEGLRFCNVHYPLSGSISLIGALTLFLLTDSQKEKRTSVAWNVAGTVACYLLFGYGVWIFVLATLASSLARWKHVVGTCATVLASLFMPPIAANRYFTTVWQAYVYPSTTWYGMPDPDNERLLALSTELYAGHYDEVVRLAYEETPNNITAVCYNLANAMQGKLPDRLMNYYQPAGLALFIPIDEESTYLSTQLAGEVWFQLGDMTMAEHAAILGMIFAPQSQSVRMVQRLAEINLINGDDEAVRKYLRILQKTQHYKQWASERMPGNESPRIKAWLKAKQALLPQADTLRLTSTDVTRSLHLLLEAHPDNAMARDYLLCFDLLQKDIPSFAADYERYHPDVPNRLYGEALMIHLYQKHASAEETKGSGVHPSVVKDFNEYNRIHAHRHGNPSALENRFGQTYWFYYQFAKFQ